MDNHEITTESGIVLDRRQIIGGANQRGATKSDAMNIGQPLAKFGFVAPLTLLSRSSAEEYAMCLRRFVERHADDPRFADWTYGKSHLLLSWIAKLAAENSVLDAVEEAIGPNITLWDSCIPVKRPRSPGYFGWHQDGTYWSIAPLEEDVVTVWIALGDVTENNGAMRIIPESNHWGQIEHEKTFQKESMLRRGQRIKREVDATSAFTCTLAPGEASMHGAYVVHGSGANDSDQWRLGVAMTFVSGRVRPRSGHTESGIWLRGAKEPSGLDAESAASEDLGERELGEYLRVTQRSAKRYSDIGNQEIATNSQAAN